MTFLLSLLTSRFTIPIAYGRCALAWTLYGIGAAICWAFDRHWCGGMHWPIYRAYSGAMLLSDAAQGDGPGPWSIPEAA